MAEIGTHHQILANRKLREDAAAFNALGNADLREHMGRFAVDALPHVPDFSGVLSFDQAGDALQRCRLACAVGSQQGNDATFFHIQGDPLQRVNFSVPEVQILHLQNVFSQPLHLPDMRRSRPRGSGCIPAFPLPASRRSSARRYGRRHPSPASYCARPAAP